MPRQNIKYKKYVCKDVQKKRNESSKALKTLYLTIWSLFEDRDHIFNLWQTG